MLSALLRLVRANGLGELGATTRSRLSLKRTDGQRVHFWPAAVLAFHFGVRAVRGQLAAFDARVEQIGGDDP